MNLTTHKIIESAHVRIHEFSKKSEEESSKEPKDYISFVYYEANTLPNLSDSQVTSAAKTPKSLVQPKL